MIRPKNGHETRIAPQSHKFHASMKFMTSCRMSHFISIYLISISYLLSVDIWFFCSFTPAVAVQPAELLYKGVPWGQQAADHHLSSERWRFREDAENSLIKILIPRTVSFVFSFIHKILEQFACCWHSCSRNFTFHPNHSILQFSQNLQNFCSGFWNSFSGIRTALSPFPIK